MSLDDEVRANLPEMRRKPGYYYEPDDPFELVGEKRYFELHGQIMRQIFLNPSLSFSRFCWGELLWKLHHTEEPIIEDGLSHLDVLSGIMFLQKWLTMFGLAIGYEIEGIQGGDHFEIIDPAPKYKTYDELLELANDWKYHEMVVGESHGAFDPPHIGHARMFYHIWPYCDVVIVGFDKNSLLKKRKDKIKEEDRPRFPQLAWRMWEIASLPTVDYVYVHPASGTIHDDYSKVYRDLGVKVVGTSDDNPYLEVNRKNMNELGGHVIADDRHVWSSTRMFIDLTEKDIVKRSLLSVKDLHKDADRIEKIALAAGYLWDYPDGT